VGSEDVADERTGNIASVVVMKSFMTKFGLDKLSAADYANTKGWIVSIATAGAVFGCLACSWLTQRLGRKWTMQIFTVIYMAGILGQTFSGGHLAGLYVARLVSGFGIGGTTVLPSISISEVT
jgi:MFS family permease